MIKLYFVYHSDYSEFYNLGIFDSKEKVVGALIYWVKFHINSSKWEKDNDYIDKAKYRSPKEHIMIDEIEVNKIIKIGE